MKFYLLIACFLIISFAFGQNTQSYLTGQWQSPSSTNELDVILLISPIGDFSLAIVPAFEYTNISEQAQIKTITENVIEKGHIKILKTLSNDPIIAQAEILINYELSTNTLEINSNQIFFLDNKKNKSLFLERPMS